MELRFDPDSGQLIAEGKRSNWPVRHSAARPRRGWITILLLATSTTTGVAAWFVPQDLAIAVAVVAAALAAAALVGEKYMRTESIRDDLDTAQSGFFGGGPRLHLKDEIEQYLQKFWVSPQARKLLMSAQMRLIESSERELVETRLREQIKKLGDEIKALSRDSRKSSIISFWGGVALSIPIGVLVNLATG